MTWPGCAPRSDAFGVVHYRLLDPRIWPIARKRAAPWIAALAHHAVIVYALERRDRRGLHRGMGQPAVESGAPRA